jgi:hypothetical protein
MGDAWFRAGVRRAVAAFGVPSRWRAPAADAVSAATAMAARLAVGARAGRREAAKGERR